MPLYEYQCLVCESNFDRLVRNADVPNPICDSCGGDTERKISVPAIIFKGSGWASDGYSGGSSIDEARSVINDMCRMKGVSSDTLERTETKARGGSVD